MTLAGKATITVKTVQPMTSTNETLSRQNAVVERRSSRRLSGVACAWFLLSVLLLVFLYSRILNMTLDGDIHGWASSNVMTQARSFLELGPWRTHLVPVQNNLPLGLDPDVYLHWPPLLPLVVSGSMRIFGDREAAGRIVQLLITLCTAGLLVLVGRTLFSLRVGMFTGFFFLTAAATYEGGRVIVQPPLAVMFAVAAVLFYALAVLKRKGYKLWVAAGIISAAFMVLASWDPIFMPLGLLLAALYTGDRFRIKLAAAYLAAAVFSFAALQADYILSYPALFGDQVATIEYRIGLSYRPPTAVRLHEIVHEVGYSVQFSALTSFVNEISSLLAYFSPFVLLAGCLFLAFWLDPSLRRDEKRLLIVGGLCLPWVLWAVVMRQYMGIHSFALVLAAPFLALAAGLMLDEVLLYLLRQRKWRGPLWVMALVLPVLIFHTALQGAIHVKDRFTRPGFRDLSALIHREAPPNAVVLCPDQFSVPVYYSRRHIVRGIESPRLLQQAISQSHAAFPGSPLYLAVRSANEGELGPVLAKLTPLAESGDAAIYALH